MSLNVPGFSQTRPDQLLRMVASALTNALHAPRALLSSDRSAAHYPAASRRASECVRQPVLLRGQITDSSFSAMAPEHLHQRAHSTRDRIQSIML
jgi:hypothetical protein